MSLKSEILELPSTGRPMTPPQGSYLIRLTGLKFWEPESQPQPTSRQASLLLDAVIKYVDTKQGGTELLEAIQIWFPSVTELSKVHKRFKRKSTDSGSGGNEETAKTPKAESKPAPKPFTPKAESKPADAPKPFTPKAESAPAPVDKTNTQEYLIRLIEAGTTNIWMVGPAGCGKTTICQLAGAEKELPVTVIPCGAGTSATTFLGYKYPEREATPFVMAFSQPGIIVLDEFTALEAQVAQICNAALANNELSATTGTVQRHPECIIIATSNTFGFGADRMYTSNNQLDASTIDRFAGGIIEVDYSKEYEKQYDAEVCNYVWRLRDVIQRNGLRKIASTRSIINACKLKAAGLDWKASITVNWTKDEKAHAI